MAATIDPVELTQALIRRPSVTPHDEGALAVLEAALKPLGFQCHRLKFSAPGTPDVENLYAEFGGSGPRFCFAGHTDVVPVGAASSWTVDPFGAAIIDGQVYGRGAADMKGAIAAFVAAASRRIATGNGGSSGTIGLLITGDEEGPAINGTAKVLHWLKDKGVKLDACVVGEPTNPKTLGVMIKIGRRGSLTGQLVVRGIQGHTAYPHLAENPVHRLVAMLSAVSMAELDRGTEHFQPSNLQITTVDVANPATNVIPGVARAAFNIRFNDRHTGASLEKWLRRNFDQAGVPYELEIQVSGEAFLTPPGRLFEIVAGASKRILGVSPEASTTGGTSDARFIKDYCPVVEFGLVGQTMHKADERSAVADIRALTDVYAAILDDFFAQPW